MFASRLLGKDVLMLARVLGIVFALAVVGALAYVFVSDAGDSGPDAMTDDPAAAISAGESAPTSGALRPEGPSSGDTSAAEPARRADASADTAKSVTAEPTTRAREKLGDASIRGRVRDSASARAIDGATVLVTQLDGRAREEWTTTTAADGSFVVEGVPDGDVLVGVRIANSRALVPRQRVTLARGEHRDLGDLDAITGASIRGRALENDTGAPVPGARVVAFQPDFADSGDGGRHVTEADAAGQFELQGPFGPGPVYLSASAPGRKTRAPYPSLHIATGIDVQDVVVPLSRAQSLRGVVLDEDRRGVAARIEVVGQGRRMGSIDTDPSGVFTIDDVVGGLGLARPTSTTEIQVRVDADGFVPASATLTLAALDAVAPHEIRVARGASIAGRCVDGSGAPLRDVRVRVYPPSLDRHARLREATTRADGSFRFAGLEAGEFAVEAEAAGKLAPQPRRTIVQLEGATPQDGVEIVFAPALQIAGNAATDAFAPLADRIVTLHHADWIRPRITRTSADGAFRFDAVPEGQYVLALRGHDVHERRVPTLLRGVVAGSLDNRFVVHEEPADGLIELRLSDATDGSAVRAATQVRFVFGAFGYPQDLTVERRPDGAGVLEFDELERADYTLVVAASGYAPALLRCVLDDAQRRATLAVTLERPVPLFGVVTDTGGLPIQDARVRAFDQLVPGAFTLDSGATTDTGGRFHLGDASKRATVVCAVAPGFAPGRTTLDANATRLGLRILLRPGARIEGTARFADGAAARDVTVQLDGAIARQFATTDAAGHFVFEDVEDGAFLLALPSGEELGTGTIQDAQGLVLAVEIPTIDDV